MDEWHKALCLTLRKLGVVELLITQADMDAIQAIEDEDQRPAAIVFQSEDGVHIRLVTQAEAKAAAETGDQNDCDDYDHRPPARIY